MLQQTCGYPSVLLSIYKEMECLIKWQFLFTCLHYRKRDYPPISVHSPDAHKTRARFSIRLFHLGNRVITTWHVTYCLPGYTSAGNWNDKRNWNLDPGILLWDTGVPSNGLTTKQSACLLFRFWGTALLFLQHLDDLVFSLSNALCSSFPTPFSILVTGLLFY